MTVGSLLRADRVMFLPEGSTKWQALRFMVCHAPGLETCDARAVLEGLERKEAILSSGLVNGFAAPHCEEHCVRDTVFLFGFSRTGIAWSSYDGEPAHFVFLLVRHPSATSDYLRFYTSVARLMERSRVEEILAKFAGARSPGELIEVCRGIEGTD